MKTGLIITLSMSTIMAFVGTYFFNLTAENVEQFLAVGVVVFADGFFGIWAGTKREGFQTKKALKVPKTFIFWTIMLACILAIEKGFAGTAWLSETIMAPFLVFQLVSILKNASLAGIVKNELLTQILDKLDKHKGERNA
jgi:phage-related holin